MAGALVIASIAAPLVVQHRLDLSLSTIALMALPFVIATVSGAAYIHHHDKRPERVFYGLTAMIVTGLLFAVLVVFPAMNSRESAKLFGEKVASVAGSPCRLAFFRLDEPTFLYYTGFIGIRQLTDVSELELVFRSSEQSFCIVKNKTFQEIKREFSVPIAVIFSEKVRGREYVLISNRAPEDRTASPLTTEKEIAVPSISKDEVIER